MVGHEAIDIVLQRVRDPQATAHSRSFVLSQLSDCQRLVNLQLAAVTVDSTFQIEAKHILYAPLSVLAPFAGKVLTVRERESGEEIPEADWLGLIYAVPDWLRRISGHVEQWGYIGRDMLFFWPALRSPRLLTLTSTLLIPDISNENDSFVMPDTYMPAILDLCELHLLTKQRSSDAIWLTTATKAKVTEQMDVAAKAHLTQQVRAWAEGQKGEEVQ